MKRHDVRFLRDALEDLEEIVLYIMQDSKESAIRMHDLIMEASNGLAVFPKRGPLVPDKKIAAMGFRMLSVERYLLFYKIDGPSTIHIHRVFHGARDYPYLLRRQQELQE